MNELPFGSALAPVIETQNIAYGGREIEINIDVRYCPSLSQINDAEVTFDVKAVGRRLKQLRLSLGKVSQQDMGRRLAISWRTYQNYEIGLRPIPFETACKIAAITGVSMEWIALGGPIDLQRPRR